MEPVRFGYVGCGWFAQHVHIPNFASLPQCEFLALAEVRQDLGRRVQEYYRIPKLYRTHLELADDPDVEAVGVSAPFAIQSQVAQDLLAAGKHVFMEKPMAVSVEQAEAILAAERAGGGRLMVAYMKRYDAGNELAKAQIETWRKTEEAGRITLARNHGFCGNWVCNLQAHFEKTDEPAPSAPTVKPEWLPDEYVKPYLGYLQQYTHNINLLRWFLDANGDVTVHTVDLDDDGYSGVVILRMGGVRAVLETGHISHYRWDEHTQIYFEHGWVHTWAPPLLLKNVPAEVEIYRAGEVQGFRRPVPKPIWSWSYSREAEHFLRCIRSGEPFRSSGQDTLHDVKVFEEIYRAYLREKGVV